MFAILVFTSFSAIAFGFREPGDYDYQGANGNQKENSEYGNFEFYDQQVYRVGVISEGAEVNVIQIPENYGFDDQEQSSSNWAPVNEGLEAVQNSEVAGIYGYPGVPYTREQYQRPINDWVPLEGNQNARDVPEAGDLDLDDAREQIKSSFSDWESSVNDRDESNDFPYETDIDLLGDYGYSRAHNGRGQARSFVNEWVVEVAGTEEVAQLVALELGYKYGGPVVGFPHMHKFLKHEHEKQRRGTPNHTNMLIKDRRVRWAEQLFEQYRVKRSPHPEPDQELHRVKRLKENEVNIAETTKFKRKPLFNDELWAHEWYLQDTRTVHESRLDLNVLPVYRMGFNGSGVRVSVLDDGIEHSHTDLIDNYDAEISWDLNDGDSDPSPRYTKIMTNSHGTRCAGEIAMIANNVKCGVGVAWGAKVGGVRMLDGRITDRVEGEAIAYAADKVDIYSASWGPDDDGRTVEGPGRIALAAFRKGISINNTWSPDYDGRTVEGPGRIALAAFRKGVSIGRGGKGAIYVWANGNGGGHRDNCNCDGYSSSIYTVSIGSVSQRGEFPWYGEVCSSTLAVAYSSGANKDRKIATTDTGNTCTLKHTGTSAATPLAAGILALALQANPKLTWRDVQHLIIWTSEIEPLSTFPRWEKNGIGLHFDTRFGFGLMNAERLVLAALKWTTVPEKYICQSKTRVTNSLSSGGTVNVELVVNACKVNYLEHVEVIINVQHSCRGALEIYLTSPQGTRVQLLSARPRDSSTEGFVNWSLMSVATWGENPRGKWTLTFQDLSEQNNIGTVGPVTLILHGTAQMPAHMRGVV